MEEPSADQSAEIAEWMWDHGFWLNSLYRISDAARKDVKYRPRYEDILKQYQGKPQSERIDCKKKIQRILAPALNAMGFESTADGDGKWVFVFRKPIARKSLYVSISRTGTGGQISYYAWLGVNFKAMDAMPPGDLYFPLSSLITYASVSEFENGLQYIADWVKSKIAPWAEKISSDGQA